MQLAAKSKHKEVKLEDQARKVMMRKLGMEVQTEQPNAAMFDEFHVLEFLGSFPGVDQ